MSNEELAENYARGEMSRRQFVRALVSSGVALVAAAAFADTLVPSALAASGGRVGGPDFYDDFYPPGHGATPPGLGGTPPGRTTPPGKGGTPPGQRQKDK